MTRLQVPVILQTAFREYTLDEVLGEGGAGRVYGGLDDAGTRVAIKVLTQTSTDKRRRFKNEIGFLARNNHPNIVSVTDHGVASAGKISGPFYVMKQYASSLRQRIQILSPGEKLSVFASILDGVEAAHLLGVTHRDLKPENVLIDKTETIVIADFGVADFTNDQLVTQVETAPTQRLANFQYAAPEQRIAGQRVTVAADIYALGLMLNELFTATVPHGTDYLSIKQFAAEFHFLEELVSKMIKQNPNERIASISEVKRLIQRYRDNAITLQRLSKINQTVIKADEIDDPLALKPPILIDVYWERGTLMLTLDQAVNAGWVEALHHMGTYSSLIGLEPNRFRFVGAKTSVPVTEGSAQMAINYFKAWLPIATQLYKRRLEEKAQQQEAERRRQLIQERAAEEQQLRVNRSLKI